MDYKNFIIKVNLWRILPGYYICLHSKFNGKVRKDLAVWKYKHTNLRNQSDINAFGWLLMNTKEFRNELKNGGKVYFSFWDSSKNMIYKVQDGKLSCEK